MTPEQKRKQQAKHDCAKAVHNRQMPNDRHFDVSVVNKPTLDTCNFGTVPFPETWQGTTLVDGAPPDNLPADTTNIYSIPKAPQRVIINSVVTRSGASFGDVIYTKDVVLGPDDELLSDGTVRKSAYPEPYEDACKRMHPEVLQAVRKSIVSKRYLETPEFGTLVEKLIDDEVQHMETSSGSIALDVVREQIKQVLANNIDQTAALYPVSVSTSNSGELQLDDHGHVTIKFKYSFELAPATYMYGAEAHDMIAQSVLARGGVETTVPVERKVHFPATIQGHHWWTPAGVVREKTMREMMSKPNRNGVVYSQEVLDSMYSLVKDDVVVEGGECVLQPVNPGVVMTFEEDPIFSIRAYMDQWLGFVRKPNKENP